MNSETGSEEGPKKTGRPLDSITRFFTKNLAKPVKNNRYWWTCNFCKVDLQGRDNNLSNHILTLCRKVPEETRTAEMVRIANEPRALPKKLRSLTGSSAGQAPLSGFVDSGLPAEIAHQANMELLRACASGGFPFWLVDNPHFRRFVSLLRPSYVLPGAHSAHTVFPESCPASFLRSAEQRSLSATVSCRAAGYEHNDADGGVHAHPADLQNSPRAEREPHHRTRWLDRHAWTVHLCSQRHLPRPHCARAGRGGPLSGEAHHHVPDRCATTL